MIGRLVPGVLVTRLSPLWGAPGGARLIVESTLTIQSMSPAACASVSSRAWILSHVPSVLNRWCRFHTVCHGPNDAGRSRQAIPVRNRKITPSTTCR